jgi:hypothetical protein
MALGRLRVRRWFGKPITGYHVCLVTCILLFQHVPQFYGGSWEREEDLLAMFIFLPVTWDFLWFACNRHFGVARFRKGQIWWFPAWKLGVPQPYLTGITLSLCAALAPALWTGAWADRRALGPHLRRDVRPHDRRGSLYAPPTAPGPDPFSGGPWRGEGQAQVATPLSAAHKGTGVCALSLKRGEPEAKAT